MPVTPVIWCPKPQMPQLFFRIGANHPAKGEGSYQRVAGEMLGPVFEVWD